MKMLATLKIAQLALSFGVIVLIWLVFPGVMVLIATGAGFVYVAAAAGAIFDIRIATWTAFSCSVLVAAYTAFGVFKFSQSGFDFLTGQFVSHGEFYFYPYLFLVVSISAIFVVIAHLVSWRWLTTGLPKKSP